MQSSTHLPLEQYVPAPQLTPTHAGCTQWPLAESQDSPEPHGWHAQLVTHTP